jgi:hypothetical protein
MSFNDWQNDPARFRQLYYSERLRTGKLRAEVARLIAGEAALIARLDKIRLADAVRPYAGSAEHANEIAVAVRRFVVGV